MPSGPLKNHYIIKRHTHSIRLYVKYKIELSVNDNLYDSPPAGFSNYLGILLQFYLRPEAHA